jgi:hypothetical protein
MGHLMFTQPLSSKMDIFVRVLNMFVNPIGYKFENNDGYGIDLLWCKSNRKIATLPMKSVARPFEQEVHITNNRIMTLKYGQKNLGNTVIRIDDLDEGMTEIDFTFGCFYSGRRPNKSEVYNVHGPIHDFIILNASIRMKEIDHSEKYYCLKPDYSLISYDRLNKDMLTFTRGNDVFMWDRSISMSRDNKTECTISFSKVDYDNPKKYIISSTGDDSIHKRVYHSGLKDEYFKVLYEIEGFDNSSSSSDLSEDTAYKHFNNSRLVNNKDVREFLDSIMEMYNKRFTGKESELPLLGGYLFDQYKNGEPNNNKVADKCLETLDFMAKFKKKRNQRKRDKGKK